MTSSGWDLVCKKVSKRGPVMGTEYTIMSSSYMYERPAVLPEQKPTQVPSPTLRFLLYHLLHLQVTQLKV